MVKIGKFSAEIILADADKMPFPEHISSNGEIFVEVEPESEYYIRVKTDYEDTVRVDISVDGNNLGYYSTMTKESGAEEKGLSKRECGKSYKYALKFDKANVRQKEEGDKGREVPFWTGKIEVEFSEAVFQGYSAIQDYSQNWKGGDVSFVMGISDPDKKKGVKSGKGDTFEVKKVGGGQVANYGKGGLLQKITLRYCSTLGLIHAGILAKPPMWDFHRLTNPAESQENVPQPNATVTGENGGDAELFDLS